MKSLRTTAAALLAAVSLAMTPPVSSHFSWQSITEKPEEGTIEIQQNSLYTPDGQLVQVGESTGPNAESLKDLLSPGEGAAIKSGSFATEEDAAKGIVRLQFDAAGLPREQTSPVSVLLVMDQTASMNMYTDYNNSWYMPCLNEDHAYYLPAGTFGDHGGGWLNILEWNPEASCFQDWFGKEDGRPWVRQWVVDMLDSLSPEKKTTDAGKQETETQPMDPQTVEQTAEEDAAEQSLLPDLHLQQTPVVLTERTDHSEELPEDQNVTLQSEDPRMARVFDSGYEVNAKTMFAWNPQMHHGIPSADGNWKTIPKPDNAPQMVNGEEVYLWNYSPADDNPYGCRDRAMLSKQYARQFAQTLLKNDPRSQVALELFGTDVPDWGTFDFTSDLSSLDSGFSFHQGLRRTNFQAAFDKADEMLSADHGLNPDAVPYVLFISDGLPDISTPDISGGEDPVRPEADLPFEDWKDYMAGYTAAQALKQKHPGTTVFTCGLAVSVEDYLSYLSSTPEDARSCTTMEDFSAFLKELAGRLDSLSVKDAVIRDTISSQFDLLVDEKHPLQAGKETCTSLDALPASVQVQGRDVTWTLEPLSETPQTLSFFVQADPSLLANRKEKVLHDTNEKAVLTYSPVILEEGRLEYGKPAEKEMPSPRVSFENSVITALKSVSPEDGQGVSVGDTITYTITLTNNGLADAGPIYISDQVPEGTEWISGGECQEQTVRFTVDSLKAQSTAEVSFQVKVTEAAKNLEEIENTGAFSLDPESKEPVPTNTVKNPLKKSPAAASPAPSAPVKNKPSTGLGTGALTAAGLAAAALLLAWAVHRYRISH